MHNARYEPQLGHGLTLISARFMRRISLYLLLVPLIYYGKKRKVNVYRRHARWRKIAPTTRKCYKFS